MRPDHHPKRQRLFRTLSPLLLASKSPRRRELLENLGLSFEVEPAGIKEPPPEEGIPPERYALSLARLKAQALSQKFPEKAVLAADTIVVIGEKILGKPASRAEARWMLELLSGRWHEVITAYALCFQGREKTQAVKTRVLFKELSPSEIEAYLSTGEPFDKAGAYAIQGLASFMVRRIEGSVTNVIGLPLTEVIEDLLAWKIIDWVEEK